MRNVWVKSALIGAGGGLLFTWLFPGLVAMPTLLLAFGGARGQEIAERYVERVGTPAMESFYFVPMRLFGDRSHPGSAEEKAGTVAFLVVWPLVGAVVGVLWRLAALTARRRTHEPSDRGEP